MKKPLPTLTALLLFAILFVSCEVDKNTVYIFSGESLIDVAFVEVNGKYTLPRSPEMEGYTFSGWKINDDDLVRNAGEEITVTGNTKVTAVWIRLC